MVKSCTVSTCQNRWKTGSKLSFYKFPVDAERREAWKNSLGREQFPKLDTSFVCGEHFITGLYLKIILMIFFQLTFIFSYF